MSLVVRIEGIHCAGCLSRITSTLTALGVSKVDLNLYTKVAKIYYNEDDLYVEDTELLDAIDDIGYKTTLLAEIKE